MLWLKPSEKPASPHAYEVQGMNRVARLSGLGVASPRLQPPGVRGRQYPISFSKFISAAACGGFVSVITLLTLTGWFREGRVQYSQGCGGRQQQYNSNTPPHTHPSGDPTR